MISGPAKLLKHLLIPHGLIFSAIWLLSQNTALIQDLWPHARYYPPLLFGLAAALCWRFHKDRYVFVLISMALCERAVYFLFTAPDGALQTGSAVYAAMGLLLPLNLAFFELAADRGLLTLRGSLRWLLIGAEVMLLAIIYKNPDGTLAAGLRAILTNAESVLPSGFSDPGKVVFLAALLILVIRFMIRRQSFEGGSIGVLVLIHLGTHHSDTGAEAVYLLSFASFIYIGAILDTSYRLAFQDELTGLPARRALNDRLARISSKYAIAMVDIDYFKKFNDTYGHDVGDQVLKMVAAKIAGVAGGGKAFRYGGEEFAIVFSGGSVHRAKPCLEALRRQIEQRQFTIRGFGRAFRGKSASGPEKSGRKSVRITVSIGVAEKNDRHPDPDTVLKAADKALYRAKRAGRNRVAA